jgi:predicted DNA-binding transcriptional regulator AlpA
MTDKSSRPLISKPALAKDLNTSTRTIDRWARDPQMDFPAPLKINQRVFFYRDEIERWKLSRVRALIKGKPAREHVEEAA